MCGTIEAVISTRSSRSLKQRIHPREGQPLLSRSITGALRYATLPGKLVCFRVRPLSSSTSGRRLQRKLPSAPFSRGVRTPLSLESELTAREHFQRQSSLVRLSSRLRQRSGAYCHRTEHFGK